MVSPVRASSGILLPLERRGHAPPPELVERRAQITAGVISGQWRTDPMPYDTFVGGAGVSHAAVRALRFRPPGRVPLGQKFARRHRLPVTRQTPRDRRARARRDAPIHT